MEKIDGRFMDSVVTSKGIIPASVFMDLAYNWFAQLRLPIHGLRYQFIQRTKDLLELYLIKGKYEIDPQIIEENVYTIIPKDLKLKIIFADDIPVTGQKYRPVISFVQGE